MPVPSPALKPLAIALAGRHEARLWIENPEEHGIGDWDLAFAHEALARAHAVAGDRAAAEAALQRARAAAEDIADPQDRALLDADLRTVPGTQPV